METELKVKTHIGLGIPVSPLEAWVLLLPHSLTAPGLGAAVWGQEERLAPRHTGSRGTRGCCSVAPRNILQTHVTCDMCLFSRQGDYVSEGL
jgi:hypothetical protein